MRRFDLVVSIFLFLAFAFGSQVYSQTGGGGIGGGGGGTGGGGVGGGGTGGGGIGGGGTGGGGTGGGGTGGGGGGLGGASDIQTIRPESITPEIEDTRRQPFVGPNRGNIQHPYSNQAAGQQGAGQRQAGGTGARGLQQGGAFGGQFGGMAGGFQQGGGLGANNTVIRRSVRTRLQNQITVANADQRDLIAQQRVQGRMFSESLINLSGSVSISVENKRATLTGSVDSPEERQLIERMARMEPGIYAIDNQIQVNGQEAVSLPASAAASR